VISPSRAALALLLLALPAPSHAQSQARTHDPSDVFVPNLRYFRVPIADPHGARMSAGLMRTNLLAEQGPERPPFALPDPGKSATEVVASVAIGGILPMVRVGEWEGGGAYLYADGRIFARFRIEYPSRDDMGQDWYVGGGVEARKHRWSGRAAIMHRSSHIGDEFSIMTGAQRIEFGSEQLDLYGAYDVPFELRRGASPLAGTARVYAGGAWIFRSYLGWEPLLQDLDISDRAVLQAGADAELTPWHDPALRVFTGLDLHAAERTGWEPGIAAALGVGYRRDRSLRLMARFYTGYSQMGEFFLTRERNLSLELVGEF
jgi:hypothetical protein